MILQHYNRVSSHKTKQQFDIFPNCSNLYLKFYNCAFGGPITIKVTFASLEIKYHFERTILKLLVL